MSLAVTGPEDPAQPGIIMAARHVTAPVIGMQFHPESVLTPAGPLLLRAMIEDLAGCPHQAGTAGTGDLTEV